MSAPDTTLHFDEQLLELRPDFRILLVMPEQADAARFEQVLRAEYQGPELFVEHADSARKGLIAATLHHFDVCVSANDLGTLDGIQFIQAIRSEAISLPLIFVLEEDDRELDERLMHAGAADTLIMPQLERGRLAHVLHYIVHHHRAFTQFRESERRLRQARKVEGIGRLAGKMAHDFNNILSVVVAYSELIRQSVDEDHFLLPDLKEIIAAGSRATELTRSLQSFRRRPKLPVNLDLNELIRSSDSLVRTPLSEGVELALDLCEDRLLVLADPEGLVDMFMNMVVNANEAMPDGGLLSLQTAPVELASDNGIDAKSGLYALLTIRDSGVGMDPDMRARIFEPFYSTKQEKGVGLGLTKAFSIALQNGGIIDVDSEKGEGSEFRIYLPLANESAMSDGQDPVDMGLNHEKSHTILIVDDDEGIREAARVALTRKGYNVIAASSGMHAIEMMEDCRCKVDLLVSDIFMPEMGGLELAHYLSRKQPTLKIILITGHSEAASRIQADDQHDGFLEKPFKMQNLADSIENALGSAPRIPVEVE